MQRPSPIHCHCGNWLGVRLDDGRVEIRHRGRRWIGRPDTIVCEQCGAETSFVFAPLFSLNGQPMTPLALKRALAVSLGDAFKVA